MNIALLLDIDGVLNEPQQPISDKMRSMITSASFQMPIYFVTGNNFTQSIDLINWHGFSGIFGNCADELRDRNGYLRWKDEENPELPLGIDWDLMNIFMEDLGECYNNHIEWRGKRMLNFSLLGRNAPKAVRDQFKWPDGLREKIRDRILHKFPDVEIEIGGKISIDIHSRGADKARAVKYLNDSGYGIIFIGDKTEPGGNDYCIKKYCENNQQIKNKVFTSTGPEHTMEILTREMSGLDTNGTKKPARDLSACQAP